MTILTVINPISGDRDKTEFRNHIESRFREEGYELETVLTEGKDDRTNIEKRIEQISPDCILSVGGDGTFTLVAHANRGKDIPIGIIPMGSSNGLASELNIPSNPNDALECFLRMDSVKSLDAIKFNDSKYFLHLGDVGLNAKVVEGFEEDQSRGLGTYAKHFIKTLSKISPFRTEVKSDGQTFYEGEVIMVGIGNGRRFGSGVLLNDIGNPFDGRFEIVIIESLTIGTFIDKGLSTINESISTGEGIIQKSCESAEIRFGHPQTLQLDGEIVGDYSELNFSIEPGFAKIVLPDHNPFE